MSIIWFHSGNLAGREIAYGGLIFFVIISVYFAAKSRSSKRPRDRFKRLIVPCLIWSLFYAALNFVGTGQICFREQNLIGCVLGTPLTHLWYLPYMFVVLIVLDKIKLAGNRDKMGTIAGIGAIALILSAPIWREQAYIVPFDLYLHALPAVLYGVFLGFYYQINTQLRWLILAVISGSILIMSCVLPEGIGIPYLFGFLPCILLTKEDIFQKTNWNLYPISSLTYGVYLIHFSFFLVLWTLGLNSYWLSLAVFLLSLISIFTIKKILPKKIYQYLI